MTLRGPVNNKEISVMRMKAVKSFFPTRFSFLASHFGIRPGCLHGMIGTTGCGKSTLIKCIIAEVAKGNRPLVWLSEENIKQYQALISDLDPSILENISFVEEKSIDERIRNNQDDFFEYFEQMAEESEAGVIFIDNVTTSSFYSQRFGLKGQQRSAEFLANFPKRKDPQAIFYIAHTESSVTDNYHKVVTPENIRGSKDLPMCTEYLYILQKFTKEDKIYLCLRNAKHRFHPDASGWYTLKYWEGAYIGDKEVPFQAINKIFKNRDFLGRDERKQKRKNDGDKDF